MRRFVDAEGGWWDVAVGKRSYGSLVLLFMRAGSGEVREIALSAATNMQAEEELAGLGEAALRDRLNASWRWGHDSPGAALEN